MAPGSLEMGEVAWIDPCCEGPPQYTPTPRAGASATLVGDTVYVFGGCGYASPEDYEAVPLNDLYLLKLGVTSCWCPMLPTGWGETPSPRWHHTATAMGTTVWGSGDVAQWLMVGG